MNIDNQTHNNTQYEQHRVYSVEENEKIVEILNSLVQINNDRIEGYGHAAEETDDTDLKVMFNKMMTKSQDLKAPLISEVRKYGGVPTESSTTLGKAFRVWMDFKATITDKDRKAILKSCEFGEDAAQEMYAEVIKDNEILPAYVVQMITNQKAQLRDDLNHVKFLREKE